MRIDIPGAAQETSLKHGPLSVAVDPQAGARLSSLKWHGVEVLKTSRDAQGVQWGSTVWYSPQKAWGWPPPAALDADPYEVLEQGSLFISLMSRVDSASGLQLEKKVVLDTASLSVGFEYVLYNRGGSSTTAGVWENTRVPLRGQCFFMSENENPRVEGGAGALSAFIQSGAFLIDFNQPADAPQKVFAQSREGWLAFIADDLMFVKFWEQVPAARIAPGQAQVEVYHDPKNLFAELEVHGPFLEIQPGGHIRWETRWFVRAIKPDVYPYRYAGGSGAEIFDIPINLPK